MKDTEDIVTHQKLYYAQRSYFAHSMKLILKALEPSSING